MLKQFCWMLLLCINSTCISGICATAAAFQESARVMDKALYETGMKYLEKDEYEKARQAFQSLITQDPKSDLVAPAYFSIGDAYYKEGDTPNLLRAVQQYKDFIIFFPADPKAPEAGMKIISSYMKLKELSGSDMEYARNAEREIKHFLKWYPDSEYVPRVQQWQKRIGEILNKTDQDKSPERPDSRPIMDPPMQRKPAPNPPYK